MMKKNRNILSSPRLEEIKRKKRRILLNKILISLFAFIVVFGLLAYISRISNLNIKREEILGNKIVEIEMIEKVVKEQIAGKYLWLFPKTNILIYPKNKIQKELNDKFKRLKDINLSMKNGNILEISMDERKALYTWCENIPLETNNSDQKCYFVDSEGYIFDEAPYFSGEVYFKFYGDEGVNIENPSGSYFFKQNFKQLIAFKDILIGMDLKPVELYITPDGDIQIFLTKGISREIGPKIIFKADAKFQKVAENLQSALSTEPFQSEFKNKYSSLLYIDLRFENKVVYKFK